MTKHIFIIFFFYLMIAMLAVGWIKMLSPTGGFTGVEWAFWVTHTGSLGIWAIIGGFNDWFRGRD